MGKYKLSKLSSVKHDKETFLNIFYIVFQLSALCSRSPMFCWVMLVHLWTCDVSSINKVKRRSCSWFTDLDTHTHTTQHTLCGCGQVHLEQTVLQQYCWKFKHGNKSKCCGRDEETFIASCRRDVKSQTSQCTGTYALFTDLLISWKISHWLTPLIHFCRCLSVI